ncbi:MAG: HAD-IA family hydrolase [Lachnospiraceae bacterium]|jgi:phosphoglycolate phosphatase|nr:HAD-IA family hydrolase [Lachnospiraceae bacterium]
MKYKYILFDLDGTLVDSEPGIVSSVKQAFEYFEINYETIDMKQLIGPPLMNSLVHVMGIEADRAGEIVRMYRLFYEKNGVYNSSLYEGVQKLLIKLKEDGYILMIATSKPFPYAKTMLEHFDILHHFTYVSASDLNRTYDTKKRIIQNALKQCDVKDSKDAVMIGDRKYDIEAAKLLGLDTIGVLYGYGDNNELSTAGADYIVKDIVELYEELVAHGFESRL